MRHGRSILGVGDGVHVTLAGNVGLVLARDGTVDVLLQGRREHAVLHRSRVANELEGDVGVVVGDDGLDLVLLGFGEERLGGLFLRSQLGAIEKVLEHTRLLVGVVSSKHCEGKHVSFWSSSMVCGND